MPATSPSPQKRPSIAERSSSTHSLSSSARTSHAPRGHRVHMVNRHSRNLSHGKGLNRLGRNASGTNVAAETRTHQRKKSGPVTPTESPKTPVVSDMKRNSSHAALSKNNSHVNLRKNHSAGALSAKRNRSHGALQKLGAPPSQKLKDQEAKPGFFELGDHSSGEDEGEWEDSTTQSPELSRNQSKASTPLRSQTPNDEPQDESDEDPSEPAESAQLSEVAINTAHNRSSAPGLRQALSDHPPVDPLLLQSKSRSTRAPPAMSTISAQVIHGDISRSNSTRSLQREAKTPNPSMNTPATGTGSSGSAGVSHFIQSSPATNMRKMDNSSSGEDDSNSFMAHYKPQLSESPEQPRSLLNKLQSPAIPSRTNQKMELQRRETMRAAAAQASPATAGLGVDSAVSLHSRSGSRAGRGRSLGGELKVLKQDYETAVKQLTVVRRFRNPILDSMHRLQENDTLPTESNMRSQSGSQPKSRPQSRRGFPVSTTATPRAGMARSPEDRRNMHGISRSNSRARAGRVQFQLSRQGSHDDIGLTTSQGSPGEFDEEQDGISPEEALIRRIWDSRVMFESEGVQTNG